MSDIVDRLRETAQCAEYILDRETATEAAAEITRLRAMIDEGQKGFEILAAENRALRARNAELVEALREIVEHCDNSGRWNEIVQERIIERCDDTARAAIAKEEEKA